MQDTKKLLREEFIAKINNELEQARENKALWNEYCKEVAEWDVISAIPKKLDNYNS